MDQDLPQHAQAEPIKKSKLEMDAKIELDEVVYYEDNGQQFQIIKDVSDGNDTDSSFDIIESEDKVRINF